MSIIIPKNGNFYSLNWKKQEKNKKKKVDFSPKILNTRKHKTKRNKKRKKGKKTHVKKKSGLEKKKGKLGGWGFEGGVKYRNPHCPH